MCDPNNGDVVYSSTAEESVPSIVLASWGETTRKRSDQPSTDEVMVVLQKAHRIGKLLPVYISLFKN